MNRLPQQPRLTQFPISTWLRGIRTSTERNQISRGGDVNVSETPSGVKIKAKTSKGFYMRWMGTYGPTSAYKEGDVVEVTSDTNQIGKDDTGASKTYESKKGIYLCLYPVPCYISTADFAGASYWVNDYISSTNHRVTNVVYYPVYPHPTHAPDTLPAGAIQGKFWQLIAFSPIESNVCEDGVSKVVWVHTATSGSAA